jgi:cyclopropane fatty-acyl-phospholipid synthase-like methyltransferase
MRSYYEAYDDRYRQVHAKQLQWASDEPSAIVSEVMTRCGIVPNARMLELGCGEGRDAVALLRRGCNLTATDISPEAIRYCRERWPDIEDHFQVLDCIGGRLDEKFDFIYAVALIHMLVQEEHRAAFYRFLREHLKNDGIALVCTMGDGTLERRSDISAAFDLQERIHGQSGEKLLLAGTSCRMVTWDVFLNEIRENELTVLEHGLTEVPPDFPMMMYAVVKKRINSL